MADKVVVIDEIYDEEIKSYGPIDSEEELQQIYKEIEEDGWVIRSDSFSRGTVFVYVERKEAWS